MRTSGSSMTWGTGGDCGAEGRRSTGGVTGGLFKVSCFVTGGRDTNGGGAGRTSGSLVLGVRAAGGISCGTFAFSADLSGGELSAAVVAISFSVVTLVGATGGGTAAFTGSVSKRSSSEPGRKSRLAFRAGEPGGLDAGRGGDPGRGVRTRGTEVDCPSVAAKVPGSRCDTEGDVDIGA